MKPIEQKEAYPSNHSGLEWFNSEMEFIRLFEQTLHRELDTHHLTPMQFNLLCFLAGHGTKRMSELAEAMGHTTPATTGLVARLAKRELVSKGVSNELNDDRRMVYVTLTSSGANLTNQIKLQILHKMGLHYGNSSRDILEKWTHANHTKILSLVSHFSQELECCSI